MQQPGPIHLMRVLRTEEFSIAASRYLLANEVEMVEELLAAEPFAGEPHPDLPGLYVLGLTRSKLKGLWVIYSVAVDCKVITLLWVHENKIVLNIDQNKQIMLELRKLGEVGLATLALEGLKKGLHLFKEYFNT